MNGWLATVGAVSVCWPLVAGCGGVVQAGANDAGGGTKEAGAATLPEAGAASCDEVCCVPSPESAGSPSFQCEPAGTTCPLSNSECESGTSCAKVCCVTLEAEPQFVCVGANDSCTEPNSACSGQNADAGSTVTVEEDASAPTMVELTCTTTPDCASLQSPSAHYVCGYAAADGCAALGVCVLAGPLCNSIPGSACACNGTTIPYGECVGYPAGYAGVPIESVGACE